MPRPVSRLLTVPSGLAHDLQAVVSRIALQWVVRLCPLLLMCLQPDQSRAQSQTYELTTQALATTPDLERGKALYQRLCERCHDAGGSGNRDREVPRLAGQQRIYLLNQLA
jgi:cytochrome c553